MRASLTFGALALVTLAASGRHALAQDPSATTAIAATMVPAPSQPLLDFEEVQLTEGALGTLNETELQLFGFENSTSDTASSRKRSPSGACKVFPGDPLWPSKPIWSLFNLVIGGALIDPSPQARVCWNATYNAAKCAALEANWTNSYFQEEDPIEMLTPEFQGMTCQVPSKTYPYINSCTLGGYPEYVVEATNVAQIQLAINFARATGIRITVRNTGHDFLGKSGGAGSLSIWTHQLKTMQFNAQYSDASGYKGPAVKVGAGVRAFELYAFVKSKSVYAVGGEAQTVGVMGGYMQGGGHSPFSSLRGMAADQVLSYEVVTPDGLFRHASSTENTDLYWALRGGGGGTFGVVTSVTLKAYPDVPCTVMSFTFLTVGPVTEDIFWAGVRSYVKRFPEFIGNGTYGYWFVYPNFATGSGYMFIMQPFFFPNMGLAAAQALVAPWLQELADLGIEVTPTWNTSNSFYETWQAGFPRETVMNSHGTTSARLIPKENWATEEKLNATLALWKEFAEAGRYIIAFHISAPLQSGNSLNAVNPAWRNAYCHTIFAQQWGNATRPEIKAIWDDFSNVQMQKWRDITPGSGAYLNEGDRNEPGWQQAFYGSNYAKLLSIKKTVDPNDVFWAATAVGSEGWTVKSVDGLPNENGRLCRT